MARKNLNPAIRKLPSHLHKYVAQQNYSIYTPEDQAVWRYILRQLKNFLRETAHPSYLEGLEKTGISELQIPKISEVSRALQKFGWKAVPVSGFIPPAAFMEFQALGYLPIACEMRSVEHIDYTPAPDIVHEAAGHAPFLVNKQFSRYLQAYALAASKAILSHEDMALYEAIRVLSDAKEDPTSSLDKISKLERNLEKRSNSMTFVSEAGKLGRMNWWTAEYGLVGDIKDPKIFGAGLLSSIGESQQCLGPAVKKIPLSVDCIEYNYDITEPQPQLFVTKDFNSLTRVLRDLESQMAFTRGGAFGLDLAVQSCLVNTLVLDTGLQISGQIESYMCNQSKAIEFIRCSGPTQLSFADKELKGHGKDYHSHGYSTPLGKVKGVQKDLSNWTASDLKKHGLIRGQTVLLEFESGFILTGQLLKVLKKQNTNLLFTFKNCSLVKDNKVYFHPSWGIFDMACGTRVTSVFGGAADKKSFGLVDNFISKKVKPRRASKYKKDLMDQYSLIKRLRCQSNLSSITANRVIDTYQSRFANEWLLGLEIYELLVSKLPKTKLADSFRDHLCEKHWNPYQSRCLQRGLKLAMHCSYD